MADKESRIFEGAIDQKLNSIANIPSAISDFIFGDEFIFLMSNIYYHIHHPRPQVAAQPSGGARLVPPPVSGGPGGGHRHGRRGQCHPPVSLHHQVSDNQCGIICDGIRCYARCGERGDKLKSNKEKKKRETSIKSQSQPPSSKPPLPPRKSLVKYLKPKPIKR